MIPASKKSTRLIAALFAVMLLLAAVLPLAVSAEDTEDVAAVPALYVEPTVITADDHTSVVTGFSVYVNHSEPIENQTLTVDIGVSGDTTGLYTNDNPDTRDWITVSEPAAVDDAAADSRPDYIVDFHKPADINVEDAAYLELPLFLRATKIAGTEIYCFAPGYFMNFRVTGGTPDEDGVYPFDHTTVFCESEAPIVSFDLARPQKFMAKLDQQPEATGFMSTYYSFPTAIRNIRTQLEHNKDTFLKTYGLSDAALYIQYDFTRLDTPSVYYAEEEADKTALWGKEYLMPLAEDPFIGGERFGFHDEAFRTRFPEGTFTVTEIEDQSIQTYPSYTQIDTETITLTARARFVLAMTAADGTVYYNTSAFTDPFSLGASNSLVAEPAELRAPVLSDPVFETGEDGMATLSFHVTANDTLLDASVWMTAMGLGEVGYDMDIAINGSDWTACESADSSVTSLLEGGAWKLTISGEGLNEYAYIRLRMRYHADISEEVILHSEWSDSLAFDKKPEETVTEPISVNTIPIYTEDTASPGELKFVCPICGICPAPYGVCLFLWIGAALLIVLLIVLIIALIPKKKTCPRCTAPCHPQEKTCHVCGYRFVGSMPEIEDTTSELESADPKENRNAVPSDDDFFAAMHAKEGDGPMQSGKQNADVPLDDPEDDPLFASPLFGTQKKPEAKKADDGAADTVPAESKEEPKLMAEPAATEPTAAEPTAPAAKPEPTAVSGRIALPAADPAFLAELKRKMAAVKAGEKQSFTPAEIVYIRALKEQKAAKAAAASKAAPTPKAAPTAEVPAVKKTPEVKTGAASLEQETDVERMARLRALREKPRDTAAAAADSEQNTPAEPKRVQKPAVQKPARQIKCPACAVPNPETNEYCYICGGALPK